MQINETERAAIADKVSDGNLSEIYWPIRETQALTRLLRLSIDDMIETGLTSEDRQTMERLRDIEQTCNVMAMRLDEAMVRVELVEVCVRKLAKTRAVVT